MSPRFVALAGGVGGAKFARGLALILPPEDLTIAVNTGDDFTHLGLHISPDLDTVMYTLAGLNNTEQGWGLQGESWTVMEGLQKLGAPSWFQLGDKDLATHLTRTEKLKQGETLTQVTTHLCKKLGIAHPILPMSDDPIRTRIHTNRGVLDFQDYFVRQHCDPILQKLEFTGAEKANPNPALIAALQSKTLEAILICPSNPLLSLGPMLAIPALRQALEHRRAPIIAISPFISGQAVKGPAAKILSELGLDITPASLVQLYEGLLDGLVIHHGDTPPQIPHLATDILIPTDIAKTRLARETLAFARKLTK